MYSVLETAAVHTHTCTCMHNFFVVNKITHFAFFVFQNQNNHFPHVTRSMQNLKQNGQHQHHYFMNKTGKIGFGTKMNRRRQTESVEKYAQINSLERVNLQKAKNDTTPKSPLRGSSYTNHWHRIVFCRKLGQWVIHTFGMFTFK